MNDLRPKIDNFGYNHESVDFMSVRGRESWKSQTAGYI